MKDFNEKVIQDALLRIDKAILRLNSDGNTHRQLLQDILLLSDFSKQIFAKGEK